MSVTKKDYNGVSFSVSDSGEGISEEFQPKLFESFTQEASTESNISSLGLGLAIVKEIVRLHGGTLSVFSSGKGKGASLQFTLPFRTEL